MTSFLFATVSLPGHINPAVPIATELVSRGHAVVWMTGRSHEATGGGAPGGLHLLDQIEAAVDRLEDPHSAGATVHVADALSALSDHLLAHRTFEEQALRPFLLSMDSWPTDERRNR